MSLYVHGVWSNISPDKWTFIDKIVRTYAIFQSFELCFGCSKEPSHWDGSFEHQENCFLIWFLSTFNWIPKVY